ncbi:MAG: hypothetical protein GFH27_549279n266 [Chloroflexi bacterium AL-W]|nr:hypothetical protein [Chloroflexi bacterium AL-N1]NOK65232.1 hypothetical protein [Chloroflexi bacterium AL-N10]NOK72503.1 hypothetical protein [Chloroflexi bacterium AL-N5]NOK79411.1 hypothetical protein [Chloroflexi bacterium AL-W]NOK87327.1 hypothetical protein [Chloroflexi bacterium AL-N15]
MMHKFLIHKRDDHVGVAPKDIGAHERGVGVYLDDDSTIEVHAQHAILLGHKIAIANVQPSCPVLEYGIQIGKAPAGFKTGDYVHTHNLKSARW